MSNPSEPVEIEDVLVVKVTDKDGFGWDANPLVWVLTFSVYKP